MKEKNKFPGPWFFIGLAIVIITFFIVMIMFAPVHPDNGMMPIW